VDVQPKALQIRVQSRKRTGHGSSPFGGKGNCMIITKIP
jgi:hypothetical protein